MTHLKQWLSLGIAAIALTTTPLLTSCQPKATKPISQTNTLPNKPAQPKKARNKPSAGQGPLTQGPLMPNTAARKVTFRQPNGAPEFSLQFKATGGKLTDRAGKVIANLILESDGAIKLTDASNKTVGYISELNGIWQIESSQRSKALFTFSREANGDAILKRDNGSAVYTLKAVDEGYTVSSDKGGGYTVSTRKGNGLLQTGEGERILVSEGSIAPAALASFGFNKLSEAQRAGLAYALATEATNISSN